jgi:hypothetical protein
MVNNKKITKYGVNMAKMGRPVGRTNGVSLLDRLLSKVIIDSNDCWIWQGGKNNIGYGMLRDDQKMRTTHRISYEEHNDTTIPSHLIVMHSCDNKLCCNPAHLSLGTRKDNIKDMINKGRDNFFGNYGSTGSAMRGKKMPTTFCVHCQRDMPNTAYSRSHGDKCKSKLHSINTITANS